jgi:hypothetical protein
MLGIVAATDFLQVLWGEKKKKINFLSCSTECRKPRVSISSSFHFDWFVNVGDFMWTLCTLTDFVMRKIKRKACGKNNAQCKNTTVSSLFKSSFR